MSVAGMAAQLILMKGLFARGELRWISKATSSLPVPLSPWMSTVEGEPASLEITLKMSCICGLEPMIDETEAGTAEASAPVDGDVGGTSTTGSFWRCR